MPEVPHNAIDSRRRRLDWWIVVGAVAGLAVGLAVLARVGDVMPGSEPAGETKSQVADPPGRPAPLTEETVVIEAESDAIDDDGRTPWVSPTGGPPLELQNLPPGVQVILAVRPRALLAHAEAKKITAALGPLGSAAIEHVEAAVGRPLAEIDQLLVGWQIAADGRWQATVLDGDKLGHAPPLPRDMERLVAHTDATRHATLLFRPSVLFGDGGSIFAGQWAALREPLFWFFDDDLSASAVSLHWDDDFFVELIGVPTLDVPPDRMASQLADRVQEMPNRVEEFVVGLDPSPHARRVVARLPGMVRKLAAYTRGEHDGDAATLRAYLPAVAGHNLLMGAELTLAEAGSGRMQDAPVATRLSSPKSEATSPVEVEERLRRTTSLRFSRDTLETALRILSDDIGVPIVIRGADLQSEGITKNQSFGIDVAGLPAGEILVEILRRANPDKLATGPGDPRQKLVYVVGRESPGGPDVVFITTRTRAQDRGDKIPAAFKAPQSTDR